MKISATAPCRVDLAGGTLDIWPLYLFHEGAVTVNFAVDLLTRASVTPRADRKITLRSVDLSRSAAYRSLDALLEDQRPSLSLAVEIIRFFRPYLNETGFDLVTDSQAPAGAGISGSSAMIIAATSAFNRWPLHENRRRVSIEKLRKISQNIEARIIRVPTGCQDYYPAMYGGVSAIELGCAGVVRREIVIDPEELERRVVLAYTGVPRISGINNWEVTKAYIDGDKHIQRNFAKITSIAIALRSALERQDWKEVAKLIRDEWSHRRTNVPGISTPLIDRLISKTRRAGATAAKVCGAGGGGCVLFLIEPDARNRVEEIIRTEGGTILPARVARHGVRVKITE